MKILVTGGAGFIGSTVVDAYINAGHTVAVIDNLSTGQRGYLNPAAAFHELDIRDPAIHQIVASFGPDVINHHAAQVSVAASITDPATDASVNILGTLNVLEAARKAGVKRFIFASSSAVYGLPSNLPIREDEPTNPISPYGASKTAAEMYLRTYRLEHDIEFVAFRYANVYGPRQYRGGECGVIGLFLHAALAGEPIAIFGSGEQTRDFVSVDDVARANLLALTQGNGVMNVGSGSATSVNELVTLIATATDQPLSPTHVAPRLGDIEHSQLSTVRAKSQLGWEPATLLAEGLAATTAWLRQVYPFPAQSH